MSKYRLVKNLIWVCLVGCLILACTLYPTLETDSTQQPSARENGSGWSSNNNPYFRPTHLPGAVLPNPTPDVPHTLPLTRTKANSYTVKAGDTLKSIAQRYGIALAQLVKSNQISNPDLIAVGQILTIPAPIPLPAPSPYKIIPDSELVNGPVNSYFNLRQFIQSHNGYLKSFSEPVDGVSLSGADIIERIASEYSVNPRLLLVVLEYQSGWLTQANPADQSKVYPINPAETFRKGLYLQLAYAANALNRGYYLWKINALGGWGLTDGQFISAPPEINAGTAGILNLMSLLYPYPQWVKAIGVDGIFATYQTLLGYPFDFAIEPLIPIGISQPVMQLPFEKGTTWSFTGGPHAGWGDGSAWAAIDFAPPGEGKGCVTSDAWVVAAAGGEVVYSNFGVVILDLDGDGYQQTGWSVLYLHVDARDRVTVGTKLHAGDQIGHPSCEGGVSNGTHIHVARRFNGEWISADREPAFNLDGWVSEGMGIEYNGFLRKGENVVEAWDSQKLENQIQR